MARVTESDTDQAISSATEKLGYKELRPKQILAVRHFLRGNDVFVSLPTGNGKSLWHSTFFARPLNLNHLLSLVVLKSPDRMNAKSNGMVT